MHVGLITEHLLPIAAAQGRFPHTASCEGANFIYTGCLRRGRGESYRAGRQRGDGGLSPGQGEQGRRLLFLLWLWRRWKQIPEMLGLTWQRGEVPGTIFRTLLVVTCQPRGNASQVSRAQADLSESRRGLRDDSLLLGDGQPQHQAGRHPN